MNNNLSYNPDLTSKRMPILSDEEAGQNFYKWSYVNIYSLKDLKDIYLITMLVDNKNLKNIVAKVNQLLEIKEKWEDRKVLEYLNALVKFELLDSDYKSQGSFFNGSSINNELTDEDVKVLRNIFLNYFRFKEISSWFINPSENFHKTFNNLNESDYINKSKPLYFYSESTRFIDTFLVDINKIENKYIIESDSLMRFWDVYLKWGKTLELIEKTNLSKIEIPIIQNKDVSMAYFIKPFEPFDLMLFIKEHFTSRNIWIPDLVFKIAQKYRYSINEIKSYIVSKMTLDEKLTYERTSEIFLIKGKTTARNIESATYMFPKLDDSYISNLILRK